MLSNISRVYKRLESLDKYEAAEEIIRACSVFDDIGCTKDELIHAVTEREKILSTGIGHGFAIMHGKLESVRECHVAMGYSGEGIEFDDKFGPVHFVFLIASTPDKQNEYLKAVSSILSWVHDEAFRSAFEIDDETDPEVEEFWTNLIKQDWIPRKAD